MKKKGILLSILICLGVALFPLRAHPQEYYDYGDYTSVTLAVKSWEALDKKDYPAVFAYTQKCIELYGQTAEEMQKSLTDYAPKDEAFNYWALNDVATVTFIQGKAYKEMGKVDEARKALQTVIDKYGFAQCWDTRGWFWKVKEGAQDMLELLDTDYDFGDYTSETLTVKAWKALLAKDHNGVELYTKKCIDLYADEARKQQAALTDFAPKDKVFDYWALNDVGTCYFILGESFMAQGKYAEAKVAFKIVLTDFGYAQCWDPKGWFWKVAVASRQRLNRLIAEEPYSS